MFDNNIKIHFAGSENGNFMYDLIAANAKYTLFSPYRFIVDKSIDDDFKIPRSPKLCTMDKLYVRQDDFRHVIQDSGLFTLMFNPKTKQEFSYQFLEQWQDKLTAFILQNGLKCTAVEVDCQKLLGVKDAWKLRERMKLKLPNKQINVFHFEDGKDGLDALIDFSEYIAISVPEIRRIHKGTYKQDTIKLAHYVKDRKPEIDIHLLGCTEGAILKHTTFCTSSDSSSWLRGGRYGMYQGRHVNTMSKEKQVERWEQIKQLLEQDGKSIWTKNSELYNARASIVATLDKNRFERICGSQQ